MERVCEREKKVKFLLEWSDGLRYMITVTCMHTVVAYIHTDMSEELMPFMRFSLHFQTNLSCHWQPHQACSTLLGVISTASTSLKSPVHLPLQYILSQL